MRLSEYPNEKNQVDENEGKITAAARLRVEREALAKAKTGWESGRIRMAGICRMSFWQTEMGYDSTAVWLGRLILLTERHARQIAGFISVEISQTELWLPLVGSSVTRPSGLDAGATLVTRMMDTARPTWGKAGE